MQAAMVTMVLLFNGDDVFDRLVKRCFAQDYFHLHSSSLSTDCYPPTWRAPTRVDHVPH